MPLAIYRDARLDLDIHLASRRALRGGNFQPESDPGPERLSEQPRTGAADGLLSGQVLGGQQPAVEKVDVAQL